MISYCLIQLSDSHAPLRQWLALCLGKVWSGYENARWCGVRDSAHEKLYILLSDPVPEVRAAAVYALGTFIGCVTERNDQSDSIDQGVAMTLINSTYDASPLVRQVNSRSITPNTTLLPLYIRITCKSVLFLC